MKNDAVLEMRGIYKAFGSLVVNDHIDFTVRRGTVHALIGENGAGKSTLMSILAGAQKPDEGEIWLDRRQVRFKSALDATKCGIGMVYQEFMLFNGMSALMNIVIGREPRHGIFIDTWAARKRIQAICEDYLFDVPIDCDVEKLPVAVRQQIEIIKVLYRDAEIVILDEPTSVLTPQGVEGLFRAIRGLIARGKTIILITHKLKEVLAIADEITVLRDGRVTGEMPAREATENPSRG
jgi:simple sugar transport system ATP-binding protein